MAETNNLGEYKIGKTIGRGAFSKIKLATHLLSEEKVAIKCITKESIAQMRKEQIESSERAKDKRASQQKIINELGGIPDPTITSSNSLATSPALSSTFIDEVKLLMRLDHPNIVKIYQLMDSPKWINIVLFIIFILGSMLQRVVYRNLYWHKVED
jgi:serine/threonine protein kinase